MDPSGLKFMSYAVSNTETAPPTPGEHLLFYGSLPLCLSFQYCLSPLIFPHARSYSFFKQFAAKSLSTSQRPGHQNERKPFLALSQAVQCTSVPMLHAFVPQRCAGLWEEQKAARPCPQPSHFDLKCREFFAFTDLHIVISPHLGPLSGYHEPLPGPLGSPKSGGDSNGFGIWWRSDSHASVVAKSAKSRARPCGFPSMRHHFLAKESWPSYLAFLCLSFLIRAVGMMIIMAPSFPECQTR